MRATKPFSAVAATLAMLFLGAAPARAAVHVQCPVKTGGAVLGDTNGDGMIRADNGEITNPVSAHEVCMALSAGDGFVTMADGSEIYTFGFNNVTGLADGDIMQAGFLAANFPAPTIDLREGDEFYLTLTNVAMAMRPDLFDAHSIHFHGFPNAAPIFDGLPEASITIDQGSSLTYYYKIVIPGTYIYHCHVEAAEHMQMGMLGNLFVRPAQDGQSKTFNGKTYTKFAYSDGDGSTGYDKAYAIQLGSFDPVFHTADLNIQPPPFAIMKDKYAMLNGRGYPDTVNPGFLDPPPDNGGKASQRISSLIQAAPNQRILLRITNLDVTRFYTLGISGMRMKVVGLDARQLNEGLYYDTNSLTLGGGESFDVILDTTNVPAGTYFLYTTNLNYLSNNTEDYGGMMTEIVVQ